MLSLNCDNKSLTDRNGKSVISAEEDDRAVERWREIKSSVGVTFWGWPFAKITDDDPVLSRSFQSVGGTSRLRKLSGQRGGNCYVTQFTWSVVDRHLTTGSDIIDVTVTLVTSLLQLKLRIANLLHFWDLIKKSDMFRHYFWRIFRLWRSTEKAVFI